MFKSIFSKYFTVMSLVIVVSFLAMGGMQLLFSTQYWMDEKRTLLIDNADDIAKHTAVNTFQVSTDANGKKQYAIQDDTLAPVLNLLSTAIQSQVLITDNGGKVLICSEGSSCSHVSGTVPLADVQGKTDDQGHFFTVGTLGDLYGARMYTAGAPIRATDTGVVIGYVFASTPADGMGAYILNNLQVFLLSALGVLTLTFIVLYAMTYRMVRPLRQMAAATRSFGNGDFSYRIPVRGKDEVAELATALNAMAVSLSSVEGMRRSFVANVSHELKTPMTTIAGFIDGILDGTIPDDKRNYYLKIVSDEVKRLSRLVKSMLDLSRIDNGQLKLTPVQFDLTEVVCNTLLSFEQRIEGKHITIADLEDCGREDVVADYDLIGQVVYNLLDNAVKFTNEGGTISLRVYREPGRVVCAVRNSGMGISPQEMPHIFERFYKSDTSRGLDKNGVGLGLYIVKTVIGLHHGEIKVRSTEGEYCEFAFWLPDNPADRVPADNKPSRSHE